MPLHDRFVHVVDDKLSVHDGLSKFSDYCHLSNIVLLGDPGAGKSYLFREFASDEGGERLVARTFLNSNNEALAGKSPLFIDALDERRAGRGDHGTIDELVRKLSQVKPEKVRIACRSADWLGNTDLSAFEAYFAQTGGYIVLNLQPLSESERAGILTAHGIEDATAFLIEASERGLDNLLGNPQNLKMLAGVVKQKNWPNTRSELFRSAVDILLEEHSDNQRSGLTGRYSPNDLRSTAGELCAVRLISDISAISLTANDRASDLPSYRSVSSAEEHKALAALGRRVFVSGPAVESVDYAHRTIAEYLGAFWLAEKIRSGLPLRRVNALLGLYGRPASELRGLHAWLAVHLPEHAEILIDADPFGVLSYADAKTLTPQTRQYLLQALAKLTESDPWFRNGRWSNAAVAGLSGPDMVAGFQSILMSRNSGFSLRMLVLDALSSGYVAMELTKELEILVVDQSAPYAEREASVDVLLRMELSGAAVLHKLYAQLGKGEEELRLRSRIVRDLYKVGLGIDEVVNLFCDVLSTATSLSIGIAWRIGENIADGDILELLDRLAGTPVGGPEFDKQHHKSDVLREFDSLLTRALKIDQNVTGYRVLQWLDFRHRVSEHAFDGNAEDLRLLFASKLPATTRVIDAAIKDFAIGENCWSFISRLRELTLLGPSDDLLLKRVICALHLEAFDERRALLYNLALVLTFEVGQDARESFEDLYEFGEGSDELQTIRKKNCVVEISDYRVRNAERSRGRAEERFKKRTKNLAQFKSQRELVRNGTHVGWLIWIANVYFGIFSDVDPDATPHRRLSVELGEKDAEVAIEGLIAFVRRGEVTDASEIIRMRKENRYFPLWYALLAGLDEYVNADSDILGFPDAFLQSALMIDCMHRTSVQRKQLIGRYTPLWKSFLLENRSDLYGSAYLALVRADLAKGAQYAAALHTLLHEVKLQPYRSTAVLALLTEFPSASALALREILKVAICDLPSALFIEIAQNAISNKSRTDESHVLWHAAGFLAAPAHFGHACEMLEGELPALLVWEMRDFSNFSKRQMGTSLKLTVGQIETILRLTLTLYPRAPYPAGGWTGDRNAWDATDYALKLIAELSADPSIEAANVLRQISNESLASDYVADIKHARAQQRVKRIDSEFRQPSWGDVVASLSNGSPAGVSDLHALVLDHLEDVGLHIAATNIDVFKRFWNEDSYGRVTSPKSEESCRDYLVELLRSRLRNQGVLIEPESHMAADKRADIAVFFPGMKVVIELKRDYHAAVWTSIRGQLERFYTRDTDAQGFGIYVVFWFGKERGYPIPKPPAPLNVPKSAKEMKVQLQSSVDLERRSKIAIVVLDVSGEIPSVS